MHRGRGRFTPSPRGRGRGGWSRPSPSSGASSDRPTQTHVGADPCSFDNISGATSSKIDASGERSWLRNDRCSGGRRMTGQSQATWKSVQPIVGGDLSSDCTKKGSADGPVALDPSFKRNLGSLPAKSSVLSGSLSQRNERLCSGKQTSRQWYKDWKLAQPVVPSISRDRTICEVTVVTSPELNYRAEIVGGDLMQSEKSDLFSDCTKKGSFDGPLGLDPSPTRNPGSLHEKSSVSSKSSSQRNEWLSNQRRTSQQLDTEWVVAKPVARKYSKQSELLDLFSDCTLGILKSIVLEKGSVDEHLDLNRALVRNCNSHCEISSASTEYAAHKSLFHCEDPDSVGGSKNSNQCDSSQLADCAPDAERFDICPPKAGAHVVLNPSFLQMNIERRKETESAMEPKATLLRTGMVLLKNYVSLSEQVNVVKECRKLGLSTGGFYQPGFRDGRKINQRMMCLGKFWDCETKSCGNIRSFDGARPPPIPSNFLELVRRSIKDSHALIAEECGSTARAEAILPWTSPDACLVNFYTTDGRLGLHQDRSESEESLRKGLPIASISIGDSAEFLYGDEREVDKAEKVTLESGDVLIFGGESRHVFHGISQVKPNTAPKSLLKETNLRPGRLNLTFREY